MKNKTSPRTAVPPRGGWRRPHLLVAVGILAALTLAGCSTNDAPEAEKVVPAGTLPGEHVHGVGRDPGTGKVNLATHEGLFVMQADGGWAQVGPTVDLMSFAIDGTGTYYASGHPADGVDLPAPVGLISSTDGGKSWSVLSRGGASDFHELATSTAGVMGFDTALRVTSDGKNWEQGGLPLEPRSLASAPDGSQVLATTSKGVLGSTDGGATWTAQASAPFLFLVAWADATTIVGLSTDGALALSTDAGRTWTTDLARVTSAQAMSASRNDAGTLEILVVTDDDVMQSLDNGVSLSPLRA